MTQGMTPRGRFALAVDRASADEIARHLRECSDSFAPPLAGRVDIAAYAEKIASKAVRFEAWDAALGLVGLVAVYDNAGLDVFVTNVSVAPSCRGAGLAQRLLQSCFDRMDLPRARRYRLEVNQRSEAAVRLYARMGFVPASKTGELICMERPATGGDKK
ncbi:GNAT family N-acetyltransferase [Variovorax boronicumulans]|uniref:GNAT family N-acetyltransferase n=1 Tax=Variovorax boronicumulans TaxID=436515 RepID=UPI00117DCC2D|nr:GNAT family N-acetyltransferase [Variovorax boronicumulans]